jgi:hypothetical protein
MAGKFNITERDLVSAWLAWAHQQDGPFLNVDAAFETWCAKHEPTKTQTGRAIRESRSKSNAQRPDVDRERSNVERTNRELANRAAAGASIEELRKLRTGAAP